MKPKFVVAREGSNTLQFHTNVEIGKSPIEIYWSFSKEIECLQGKIVADMVKKILDTNTVSSVCIKPYQVSVHFKSNSTWNNWSCQIEYIVHDAVRRLADKDKQFPGAKKVIVEEKGNTKTFHTNFEVSQSHESFWRPLRNSSERSLQNVGNEETRRFVKKVMSLPGVTEICISPYRISIEIAKAFTWNDLNQQIKDVFQEVFGPVCFN